MKVKLIKKHARAPFRANPTDAGADLFSTETVHLNPKQTHFIPLGLVFEIPEGYAGFIYARSGLGSRVGLRPRNCVGIIDCKYRGEVGIMVENSGTEPYAIYEGERIAQIVIAPILTPEFEVVEELDMSGDRCGGFGSTGV